MPNRRKKPCLSAFQVLHNARYKKTIPDAATIRVFRCPTPKSTFLFYFSFFLGRSWFEWPHFRFLQLVALGGRRACFVSVTATRMRGP